MCQECRDVAKLWPRDDDYELTEEEFGELFAAAERVTVLPGPHTFGVGVAERSYDWATRRDAWVTRGDHDAQ